MENRYSKKIFNIGSAIGSIFSLIQIPNDLYFINQNPFLKEYLTYYLFGRLIIAGSFIVIIYKTYNKPLKNIDIVLSFIFLMIYAAHGQFFMPGYFIAYLQLAICTSLFFALPKKIYTPLLVCSGIIISSSIILSKASYASNDIMINKFKGDMVVSVIIISILSYFGYNLITLERYNKDLLYQKFTDIGKNSAILIHDLKGVVFGPLIYINILEKKIQQNKTEDLEKNLLKLKEDYTYLIEYIKSFNSLSKVSQGIVEIDSKEIIESISKIIFKSKFKDVQLLIEGSGKILGDEQMFKSIVINLIKNSLENFEFKIQDNKFMKVLISDGKIVFIDNGGGFQEDALKKIKENGSFTTKKNGSGIGMFMIKEYMQSQNGSSKFYNKDGCAIVELNFNQKEVI